MREHRVIIAPSAARKILAIASRSDARKVALRIEALSIVPEMGVPYDPVYEAARPPHQALVTYAGHFGLYYTFDEETETVAIEYVEDERHDPKKRFAG